VSYAFLPSPFEHDASNSESEHPGRALSSLLSRSPKHACLCPLRNYVYSLMLPRISLARPVYGLRVSLSAWRRLQRKRAHVGRSLHISVGDSGVRQVWKSSIIAIDLIKWLSRTTYLSIQSRFEDTRSWDLIRHASSALGGLEHLRIIGCSPGFDLPSLFKKVKFRSLRSLEIRGIVEWKEGVVELGPEVPIPCCLSQGHIPRR
jgi:hypothetical protein